MDEKKLRTETSIPHSKIGKLPRIQISQWLEDVFLPFCAEWMIPMKKCHKFCFRCSAAMFRSDVRYISISSAQFRYPVMLFPLYQITEAHLASHVQTGLFFLFFWYTASNGVWWMLVVVRSLRSGNPCDCWNFSTHSCTPAMDIFTKRWCVGKGDLPLVSLLILGYDTFLDVLVPIAVTSHVLQGSLGNKPGFLLAEVHPILFHNTWLPQLPPSSTNMPSMSPNGHWSCETDGLRTYLTPMICYAIHVPSGKWDPPKKLSKSLGAQNRGETYWLKPKPPSWDLQLVDIW